MNNVLDTDSYKLKHYEIYPSDTQIVYSYFESRIGAMFPTTRFFGLQYVLNQLTKPITMDDLEEAFELSDMHGVPLNYNGFKKLIDKHNGKLPVKIKAVPEGSIIPISNALITIENTDTDFPWLTNYLETQLSRVWYPTTVCTLSYHIKQLLLKYAEQTCDHTNHIDFQLHDFGSRGVSCREQAGIGGMAHLVNFKGTDTIMGLKFAHDYYNAPLACGYSIPATEHSIMTALGKEGEFQVLQNCLNKYPEGPLAVVTDSYDWKNFINVYVRSLKDQILNRNGKLIPRPDSGNPSTVSLTVCELLADIFGFTYNKKGFKVLHPKVGMLWGDGIDYNGIRSVCETLIKNGFSTENIAFGSGGGLLQKVNRDSLNWAGKCSAQMRNNIWYDIYKEPIDTDYVKKSKKGILKVINSNGEIKTVNDSMGLPDLLETVFLNGEIVKSYNFETVRNNA